MYEKEAINVIDQLSEHPGERKNRMENKAGTNIPAISAMKANISTGRIFCDIRY